MVRNMTLLNMVELIQCGRQVGETERRPLKGGLTNYEIKSVFVAGLIKTLGKDGGRWRTYDFSDRNPDNFEKGIVWALRGFLEM